MILPDPRLEAPGLLYPGRKPAGPVKIDWDHPLTDRLARCFVLGPGNHKDLVGGYGIRINGSFGSDEGGTFYKPEDTEYIDTEYYPHNQTSMLVVAKRGSASTTQIFGTNDGSNHRFYFGHTDSNVYQLGWGDGFSLSGTISDRDAVGEVNTYMYNPYASASGAALWVNGKGARSTATYGFSGVSTTSIAIGRNPGSNDSWDYPIYFCCVWDREFENDILASLTTDPYQFLIPA